MSTASNHSIYAQWTANTYTITFVYGNGSANTTTTITYDSAYGELPTPSRTDYTFMGWYTTGGDQITNSTKVQITSNQTLYAQWKINAYELADFVSVGDYVAYPVTYNNVPTHNGTSTPIDTGWRVLNKNSDGTIDIISAGVPLQFWSTNPVADDIIALTTNFLITSVGTDTEGTFVLSGFDSSKTLTNIFFDSNNYTLSVRSLMLDDLVKYYGGNFSSEIDIYDSDMFKLTVSESTTTSAYYHIVSTDATNSFLITNGGAGISMSSGSSGGGYYGGSSYPNIISIGGIKAGVRPVVTISGETLTTGKNSDNVWELVE